MSISLKQALAVAGKKRTHPRGGDGYTVHLVMKSSNAVTGPMPVAMTDAASCPTSCPLRDRGCWAENMPTALQWRRVPQRGVPFATFAEQVRKLPDKTAWRYGEAGDLPGRGDALDVDALHALVDANSGRNGYTYTHKHREPYQREAIRHANANGFTVNLSTDSLGEADDLAALEIGPVVVTVPEDAPDKFTTPAGRPVIVCLFETQGRTCLDCKLCSKQREVIVAFRYHGSAKGVVATADALRRSADRVRPRTTTTETT